MKNRLLLTTAILALRNINIGLLQTDEVYMNLLKKNGLTVDDYLDQIKQISKVRDEAINLLKELREVTEVE